MVAVVSSVLLDFRSTTSLCVTFLIRKHTNLSLWVMGRSFHYDYRVVLISKPIAFRLQSLGLEVKSLYSFSVRYLIADSSCITSRPEMLTEAKALPLVLLH